jgi:hypothetical protein
MQLIFEQYHPTKDRQNVQVIYYLCMAHLLRHKDMKDLSFIFSK